MSNAECVMVALNLVISFGIFWLVLFRRRPR